MGRPKKNEDEMSPIALSPYLTERLRAASILYSEQREPLRYTGTVSKEMKGEIIQTFSSDNEIAMHYIRRGLMRAGVIKGLDMFIPDGPKFNYEPPVIEKNLTRLVIRVPDSMQKYLHEFTENGGFQSTAFAVRFLINYELGRDGIIKTTGTVMQTLVNR